MNFHCLRDSCIRKLCSPLGIRDRRMNESKVLITRTEKKKEIAMPSFLTDPLLSKLYKMVTTSEIEELSERYRVIFSDAQ